jgi:hypothetical protein
MVVMMASLWAQVWVYFEVEKTVVLSVYEKVDVMALISVVDLVEMTVDVSVE